MSDYILNSQDESYRHLQNQTEDAQDIEDNSFFSNSNWSDTGFPKFQKPPSPIFPTDAFEQINFDNTTKSISSTLPKHTTVVNDSIDNTRSKIFSMISMLNDYVISHPFIVIRRQCQVTKGGNAYHLTPFTVIPLMFRLQSKQGISTFFKGLPSILVNHVLLIGTESLIFNLLNFPIEYNFGSFANLCSVELLKHLALKSLAILIVTPFICSGSVETVQSLIVSESPYPLEHLKEGVLRIIHVKKDRKLPFYSLIGPSIAYHLCYYLLYSLIRQSIIHFYTDEPQPNRSQKTQSMAQMTKTVDFQKTISMEENVMIKELKCTFYAHMLTDIITYPFQNILYRLFLQGTRTLIDDVGGLISVVPLISNYDSAADCYHSILVKEGSAGLFKGFGALILQYSIQASILQMTNCLVNLLLNG